MATLDKGMMNLRDNYSTALAEYVNYTDGPFSCWLRQHKDLFLYGSILVLSIPMFTGIYLGSQLVTMVAALGFVAFSVIITVQVLLVGFRYSEDKREYQDKAREAVAQLCQEVIRHQTGKSVAVKSVVVDEGEDGVTAYADFKVMLLSLRYYPTSQLFVSSVESRYGSDVEYEDYDLMQLVKRVYESEILPQLNILHIGVVAD